MPAGRLVEIDETGPLRQMEKRVYDLEAVAFDAGRRKTAEEVIDLAHEAAARRKPSFEQALAVSLLGRYTVRAGPPSERRKGPEGYPSSLAGQSDGSLNLLLAAFMSASTDPSSTPAGYFA